MDFFNTMFEGKKKSDFILLWEKATGHSTWCPSPEQATNYAKKCQDRDIYFGVGTSPRKMGEKKRCPMKQIAGIPGLWLDLDMKHSVHEKKRLPETEADLANILEAIPFVPSLTIESGHGRQYWWLFKEFWNFESEEERKAAQDLIHRFQIVFRDHAGGLGFEMDMVHDLARILRIPETVNCKDPINPVPVILLKENGARYTQDDLDQILPPIDMIAKKAVNALTKNPQRTSCGNLMFDHFAEPPGLKLTALIANDRKFKQTWEMKRVDFPSGKNSPSEYDFALGNLAFQADWNDQEVLDLLIAFRRKHSLKPKTVLDSDPLSPLREAYYLDVLVKTKKVPIEDRKVDMPDLMRQANEARELPSEDKVKAAQELFNQLFGLSIDRIIKFSGDDPSYRIETQRGVINIDDVYGILTQDKFRGCLAMRADTAIPLFKKQRWLEIASAILGVCVEEELGSDNTIKGAVANWVRAYIQMRVPAYDKDEGYLSERPFFYKGNFWLQAEPLRQWLIVNRKESQIDHNRVCVWLYTFGFRQRSVYVSSKKGIPDGKSTNFSAFHIPWDHELVASVFDPIMAEAAEDERKTNKNFRLVKKTAESE